MTFKSFVQTATLMLAFVTALAYLGPEIDAAPDTPAVTDAQAAAMHQYMQELEVARNCRLEHGESLIRRTDKGEVICIPRK